MHFGGFLAIFNCILGVNALINVTCNPLSKIEIDGRETSLWCSNHYRWIVGDQNVIMTTGSNLYWWNQTALDLFKTFHSIGDSINEITILHHQIHEQLFLTFQSYPNRILRILLNPIAPVTKVFTTPTLTHFTYGSEHLLFTDNNKVYGYGDNSYGQIGTTNCILDIMCLLIIPNLEISNGVKFLQSGDHHSLLVTNENRIYTWGRNTYGQLGDGGMNHSAKAICLSDMYPFLNRGVVTQIHTSHTSSIVHFIDGSIYGWGKDLTVRRGQRMYPTPIRLTPPSSSIKCSPKEYEPPAIQTAELIRCRNHLTGSTTPPRFGMFF